MAGYFDPAYFDPAYFDVLVVVVLTGFIPRGSVAGVESPVRPEALVTVPVMLHTTVVVPELPEGEVT
jgi:hypothetical protein